jgi:alkanesulfonate monooxygenase SsuD/methylene tetrahydromethanopterin reductase-like flavin-dependent oxidoreductase (luciferase family)
MNVGLWYNLRSAAFGVSHAELYATVLDQAAWADDLGFNRVQLNEHHGAEDGYLPAPLTFGSAVAGRTKRIGIMVSALLVPLYQPIRLAEEIAVLDLVSRGRLTFILGAGYRQEEFAMFDADLHRRGELMEQGVAILKQAWSGEAFEYHGKMIRVRPTPFQRPHPPIILGGSSGAAARRAARIGDGFVPSSPELMDVYNEERVRLGKEPVPIQGYPAIVNYVAEDVDAAWKEIGPYFLHENNSYADWIRDGSGATAPYSHAGDVTELRALGIYTIATPERCVELARDTGGAVTITPMVSGLPPDIAWRSLRLFEEQVVPELRELDDSVDRPTWLPK